MLAVDAARWWGPLGWLYRNTPGNIAASIIWAGPPFVAGAVYGKRRAVKTDAHNLWMAQTQAAQHRQITGEDPPQHPHLTV